MLSRTQSTDAIVSRDIDLRELENAEARGVNNKTFSEIYENSNDLEDGAFMVDNPQLALKKQDTEYMKEVSQHSSSLCHDKNPTVDKVISSIQNTGNQPFYTSC